MSREIVLGIGIHTAAEPIYTAIASKEGLSKFWVPNVTAEPVVGSESTFQFTGAPVSLRMRVDRLDEAKEIEWTCLGDFPNWEGTKVTWSLSPEDEHGGTNVLFMHTGFSDDVPSFELGSVAHTWSSILDHLKELAETGTTTPPLT
ncbi:MAG: SRPBCC domain-containing protein [Actinomycetota bacterium]